MVRQHLVLLLAGTWRYVVLVGAIVALLAAGIPSSFAHPLTVSSTPKPFASVSSVPEEIAVTFSEPIELSYSRMSVLAGDGTRVDNNDPHNVGGDTATLAVTLKPDTPDGVYTVTTKVLSAVDGHVVESAFTFGIGTKVDQGSGGPSVGTERILSIPESLSRFPGMVGQVIVVGAAFGTLWLWKPLERVPWLGGSISPKKSAIDRNMTLLVIIGTALVLASNGAMIAVQAYDIGGTIQDAISTKFGNIWTIRMIESSILMIIAFFVYRKAVKTGASPTKAEMLAILVMGLAVLVTSGLVAHGAATGEFSGMLLDFFHNAAASIWIGGLVLMGFVAIPKLLSLSDERAKSAAISILVPRFSTVVVTLLGISVMTGPLLLFIIESNLSVTLASTYGSVLITKLALAGVMVAMGAYSQFVIQKRAVVAMSNGSSVQHTGLGRYSKLLKAEAGVGFALLLMVSLMANSATPSSQFPQAQGDESQAAFAAGNGAASYTQTLYAGNGRIGLAVDPFVVGQNMFTLSFFDKDGNVASDVESATIKLTQVERGVGPIEIDTERKADGVFATNAAFSLPGKWSIEIEGVRPQSSNIVSKLDALVKPAISDLKFDLKEYPTPMQTRPLFPVYDTDRQSIWAGDTVINSGRMLQLDMRTGNYTEHKLDGPVIVTQMVLDSSGRLWYIDPIGSVLGLYDPDTRSNEMFALPEKGTITGLVMDHEGNLWMPVFQPNKVFRFTPQDQKFASVEIPTAKSAPVGIAVDKSGLIWMAESIGKIAVINPQTGDIREYEPSGQNKLVGPTSVFPYGNDIYISEHDGHTVTVFNPLFETFREFPALSESGLPFGMVNDNYGNIWVAEHTLDRLGVIDPRTGESTEVKIPTSGSTVQWLTKDSQGRIWFAEQLGSRIGSLTVTFTPSLQEPGDQGGDQSRGNRVPDIGFSFADAAGPGIAAGIVLAGLFYAKSATDLKRNVRTASRMG